MAKKTENKKQVALKVEHAVTSEILNSAAEEINAAVVEFAYISNITKVQMFWEVGRILRQNEAQHGVNISDLVARTADDNRVKEVHMSERNLWFAIKVLDSFPAENFKKAEDKLPDGKNTSISKLKKLLVKATPVPDPTMEEIAAQLFRKYGPDGCKKIAVTLNSLIKRKAQKK